MPYLVKSLSLLILSFFYGDFVMMNTKNPNFYCSLSQSKSPILSHGFLVFALYRLIYASLTI